MPSPFPGMDPYIEHPNVWSDFHGALAEHIRAALNTQIQPNYVARMTPHLTYDVIEVAQTYRVAPDVGIWQTPHPSPQVTPAATAAASAPVENLIELETPVRLYTVEIQMVDTKELVTAIEILSPVNKRISHPARRHYQRKRRDLLNSAAHFMELDLLRGGERSPLQNPLPPAHYYVTLSRAHRRPRVEVWPINFWEALPILPVPLRAPDPDAVLDLGTLVAELYQRGGYATLIDYRQAPPPPRLSESEEQWLDQHLKAQGRR